MKSLKIYNVKIKNIVDKIPDITNLSTKTTLNAKINEVKGERPSITKLATTAALTTVENKVPNVSNLVKKTDQETKIRDIFLLKKITDDNHDEYISNPEFNEFPAEVYAVRLRLANLANKKDISNFAKKKDFGNKLLSFNKIINLQQKLK